MKNKKKPLSSSNNNSKEESCHKLWKEDSETQLLYSDISQNTSEEVINNVTLDPDVLRWENPCENLANELSRIEIYKTNRRLRYINARNNQLALVAIKERM